jgi:type IV pilus assembly protein PilQ
MGPLALPVLLLALASEPDALVSLDVKDAPVADVVRALAEAGGFQAVLDPGITCRVTLKLNGAAYERALASVLRACSLAYEGENGVLRVAPLSRLTQEAAARRRLAEEQRASLPRSELRLRLSYARAAQVAPLLRKHLSPRGEVAYDERTNTLILID